MLRLLELMTTEEYFTPTSQRREAGVYFYRFCDYTPDWKPFFLRLFDEARRNGAVVLGKIPNPDRRQLDFYEEMMGPDFALDRTFLEKALNKWLPRLNAKQRTALADPLWEELNALKADGKTDNMLRNAYIKFMCWLYYRFEQLMLKTGGDQPPKLLYEGGVGDYQLRMLSILAKTGCDIALIHPEGEAEYQKADPTLRFCKRMPNPKAEPFPQGFTVSKLQSPPPVNTQRQPAPQTQSTTTRTAAPQAPTTTRMNIPPRPGSQPATPPPAAPRMTIPPRPGSAPPAQPAAPGPRINVSPRPGSQPAAQQRPTVSAASLFRPEKPQTAVNINTWLRGDLPEDALRSQDKRGSAPKTIYKMFVRMRGVEDKNTYLNDLVRLKLKLEGASRPVLLLEKSIPMPTPDEISKIRRENATDRNQMLSQLAQQLSFNQNREVERHAQRAFLDLLGESEESLQKLTNRAVSLLCLLRRYLPKLFPNGKYEPLPTLIYYGACANENEATFFRILARLPADIWIICPDLDIPDSLRDPLLFDRNYENSMPLENYPQELDSVRFGTVAFHAEQELNSLLYENSGMYRNHQFKKAIPVTIQTTYEEIGILWDQEAKYRPNFETLSDRVMVPVICAKISGVPNDNVDAYWNEIHRRKQCEDLFYSEKVPFLPKTGPNPMVKHAPSFIKNGKLLVNRIKSHPAYPYAFIREDMQDYMMDKLNTLVESRLIAGTFENGAEYTIVSTALNLDKAVLRTIQKYDFTKNIPKLLLVNTGEQLYSLEDSIVIAYLNLLGFDIAVYVPTGYQIERYYTKPLFVEKQAGNFMYDLPLPDWDRIAQNAQKKSFTDILFRRGT